jgi:hypothetical protein
MKSFRQRLQSGTMPTTLTGFHEAFGGGTVAGTNAMPSSHPTKEDS